MTESVTFPSATSNVGLPLLFAGQAQKEFFLNQAFAMLDALITGGIEGSLTSPPSEPAEGSAYRVLGTASDAWTGREDEIAVLVGGAWAFIPPSTGLSVFDRTAGHLLTFNGTWSGAIEPSEPLGGSVIDTEARTAIAALIEAMRTTGIFISG